MFNHIGPRIKEIRTSVFQESQAFFCLRINDYFAWKYSEKELKKLSFNQPMLCALEKNSKITVFKLNALLEYLNNKKKVSPNWVILPDNSKVNKFDTNSSDPSLLKIIEEIKFKNNIISDQVLDLDVKITDIFSQK